MKGQALITLLFFTVIAVTVTSAAVAIIVTNSLSGTKLQQGLIAYQLAQTGAEEAKLRLLRDPSFSGETFQFGGGSVGITVNTSGSDYTIVSKGTTGNFMRQIQIDATYNNNLFTINSQKEIF